MEKQSFLLPGLRGAKRARNESTGYRPRPHERGAQAPRGQGPPLTCRRAISIAKEREVQFPMGANNNKSATKGTNINWINITPLGKESWTDVQKAQAILIKHKDLMASAFLKFNEAQAENEEMPSQFTLMANHIVESPQGAKDTTKVAPRVRITCDYAKFIMHCSKVLMINTEERAGDIESSVPYSVKHYQKTPEMAKALVKQDLGYI